MRRIALGLAIVAVIASGAAFVVALRGGGAPAIETHEVRASEFVKIVSSFDMGHVKDPALAKTLGLAPDDTITSISFYVERKQGGPLRWKLDGDLVKAMTSGWPSTAHAPPSAPAGDDDALLDTIVKLDDLHYAIPRTTVDAVLANPARLAMTARIVPAMRDGHPDGFKLYAIRPNSLLDKLGFKNGDTIRGINGYDMTSPAQALEIYEKVKSADALTIDLDRRGTPAILTITIK